jgi:hypothetical protein
VDRRSQVIDQQPTVARLTSKPLGPTEAEEKLAQQSQALQRRAATAGQIHAAQGIRLTNARKRPPARRRIMDRNTDMEKAGQKKVFLLGKITGNSGFSSVKMKRTIVWS